MRHQTKTSLAALGLATLLIALLFNRDLNQDPEPHQTPLAPDSPAATTSPNPALPDLAAWQANYAADPAAADDATLLQQGIELARAHRAAMLELLQSSPELALQSALTFAEHAALPPEMQALVETPFTAAVDIDILAVCDTDPLTPETRVSVRLPDGAYAQTAHGHLERASFSKLGVPVQGIQLDGWAALSPTVFQIVDTDNLAWATESLPLANPDPQSDFLTGQPIAGQPVHAIAGGYLFAFANSDNLTALETQSIALDNRPGPASASRSILAFVEQRASGPLPLQQILQTQHTIAIDNGFGDKSILFIRVDFPDKPGSPFEATTLENLVYGSVASMLRSFSFDQTDIEATASTKVYRLETSATYDNENGTDPMMQAAIAAYIADGNPDPTALFDVVCVSFPKLSFSWAGLATVGGARQWLNGIVPADVILHELGHNFGLKHANYSVHDNANPASTNPVDPTGGNEEYGDEFDNMGNERTEKGHFHMAAKQLLGWIPDQRWSSLDDPSDNGTYRIYPFDTPAASGLQALRVAKSATNDHYWLGKRSLFEGQENFAKGAYLLWQRSRNAYNQTWLVDATPLSPDGKNDAGIPLGATYADPASNLYITPLAVGSDAQGEFLDVHVAFGPFPGNQPPTATLDAPTTGEARSPIAFSVSATDPNGDPLAFRWDFGDGVNENSAASLQHSFPVGGVYQVSVTVSDMKGGSLTLSQSITVSDPINTIFTRSSGTAQNLKALAANSSHVIAAGDRGAVVRSTDGETWQNVSIPTGGNVYLHSAQWTGSEFLAAGFEFISGNWRTTCFKSPDGAAWTRIAVPEFPVGQTPIVSIASADDGIIQVLASRNGKLYVRNASTETWTIVDFLFPENVWSDNVSVAYGDGYFILGAYNFAEPDNNKKLILKRSPDGLVWEDLITENGLLAWHGQDTVAYLGGQFVGSGFFSSLNYSLNGGVTWGTNLSALIGSPRYEAESFAFGNGIYSANGSYFDSSNQPERSVDLLSTNGRTWVETPTTAAPDQVYADRIFFNNSFLSVGPAGLIRQTDYFNVVIPLEGFALWISTYEVDPAQAGALDNADSDWAVNFIEYALGSDPSNPASAPRPPELSFDAQGRLLISVHRFAKTELPIVIEYSTNLSDWSDLPAATTADTETLLQVLSTQPLLDTLPLYARFKLQVP